MDLVQKLLEAKKPRFNTTMKALKKIGIKDITDFVNNPGETLWEIAKEVAEYKGYGADYASEILVDYAKDLFGIENDLVQVGDYEIGVEDFTQDMVSIDGVPLVEIAQGSEHHKNKIRKLEKEKKKLLARIREIDDELGTVELE